jgi:hypothetical protein
MFLQVALKAGCDCAAVIVTNDFSRKIFENFGMENIKTESWNEFKTADGKLMFQNVESNCVSTYFVKLSNDKFSVNCRLE